MAEPLERRKISLGDVAAPPKKPEERLKSAARASQGRKAAGRKPAATPLAAPQTPPDHALRKPRVTRDDAPPRAETRAPARRPRLDAPNAPDAPPLKSFAGPPQERPGRHAARPGLYEPGAEAPPPSKYAFQPGEVDTRPPRDAQEPAAEGSRGARPAPRAAESRFFASCPKGLEAELVRELAELGIENARPAPGGVAFRGHPHQAWKANLWSRLAVRVLWLVGEGRYLAEDDLYEGAAKIDWSRLLTPSDTIAVSAVGHKSPLKSLNFAALRIKDAVCDRLRNATGERPSVDARTPDIPLVLYLTEERYSLYVDLSGEPLNRRGFRVEPAPAPLNENLAAGLLRLSGWQPGMAFFDPMMGGGTLLIEAAMMALKRAPGLKRRFAFEKLATFDSVAWQRLRREAEALALPDQELPIFGSDNDPAMVRAASINLKAAGVLDCVNLLEADVLEVEAPPVEPGILISNPPYGVRLTLGACRTWGVESENRPRRGQFLTISPGNRRTIAQEGGKKWAGGGDLQPTTPKSDRLLDDQAAFYLGLGDALKKRFAGWNAFFITADETLPKGIGLSANRRTPLYNGPLECRFYEFRMVSGSNRRVAPAARQED